MKSGPAPLMGSLCLFFFVLDTWQLLTVFLVADKA